MKQLSLLAAVLVVAACSEAPTAPGAHAASPSEVAQVARRTAGLSQTYCGATPYVTWTFLATVTNAGDGTLVDVGDTSTATLEFCAVAVTTDETPFDLIVPRVGSWPDGSGTITVGVPTGGATFDVLSVGGYSLVSNYSALPAGSGVVFGTLTVSFKSGDLVLALSTPQVINDPTDKNACMKDGWRAFNFKNQGQCVRFVETGKDSRSLPTP